MTTLFQLFACAFGVGVLVAEVMTTRGLGVLRNPCTLTNITGNSAVAVARSERQPNEAICYAEDRATGDLLSPRTTGAGAIV